MTVDFTLKRSSGFRVGAIVRVGPWRVDNLRTEFGELTRWARKQKLGTGRWIFLERSHHRWEACLEIVRGEAHPEGRIRLKTLPATWVASVTFDPEEVSSRVVYHGLHDWIRARKKQGEIRSLTGIREVYLADPWADPRAWARCEVQFLVRK